MTIELSERELFSKSLLAMEMARRGYRVYIGSFRSIHEIHRKIKSCIFFHKSAYKKRAKLYKKRMGAVVAFLDEELGPAISPSRLDDVIRRRMKDVNCDDYDVIFTLGEDFSSRISSIPNIKGVDIVSSGWPRIDLWRNEFLDLFANEINNIRSSYGKFLFFISSFGVMSAESYEYRLSSLDAESEINAVHNSFAAFKNYVALIKQLASQNSYPIVVRPHTSESVEQWSEIFEDYPSVFIVREGDVTPWLHAASAVLTYRSTVAIQAAVAGIPVVQYMINDLDDKNDALVYKVSKCLDSFDEVNIELKKIFNRVSNIEEREILSANLGKNISSLNGSMAFEKIADKLQVYDVIPQLPIRLNNIQIFISNFWHMLKRLEHVIKKKLFKDKSYYRPSRFEKIPNGIKAQEVANNILNLGEALGHASVELSCRQAARDLVEVELQQK